MASVVTESVFTEEYNRFRQMLIQARKNAGMTQLAVSEAIGKPQSFVSKYERGERRLDVIEFMAVAHVLGIDPREFIDRLTTASE